MNQVTTCNLAALSAMQISRKQRQRLRPAMLQLAGEHKQNKLIIL